MVLGFAGPGREQEARRQARQCMLNRRARNLGDAANQMGLLSANELLRRGMEGIAAARGQVQAGRRHQQGGKCGAERQGGWGRGPARRQSAMKGAQRAGPARPGWTEQGWRASEYSETRPAQHQAKKTKRTHGRPARGRYAGKTRGERGVPAATRRRAGPAGGAARDRDAGRRQVMG